MLRNSVLFPARSSFRRVGEAAGSAVQGAFVTEDLLI